MRAIIFDEPGGAEVLARREIPAPLLGEGELRIRVAGAGVNRADLLQRRGLYPPPPGASEILGLECAGEVLEVGPEVSGWTTGDRVMALLAGGGYAEEVVVDAGSAMPTPAGLSDVEAGGFPEAFLTAFLNLFLIGGLGKGQTALVHGGSGGVGTAAIQLCREAGAPVAVTAGDHSRCTRCRALGAALAIDYRSDDFAKEILRWTDGRGVDVVLDCIGGKYLERNLGVLTTGGRLVVIGLMGGASATLDLAAIMRKRLSITGSTLRARPVEEKASIVRVFLDQFGDALAAGRLRPQIHAGLLLGAAKRAHRLLESGAVFGKVVLSPCGALEGKRGMP